MLFGAFAFKKDFSRLGYFVVFKPVKIPYNNSQFPRKWPFGVSERRQR
jgi:hypothetical protein